MRDLQKFSQALTSNPDWMRVSLHRSSDCEYLLDADAYEIAEQLFDMGFTHFNNGKYVKSTVKQIVDMIDAYDMETV